MKPLRRYNATPLTTPTSPKPTTLRQSISYFLSAYHFHYFHFQFCVLSIKIYQRIYSRKTDNNSVTRGKARFIYLQLQLYGNLSRVRRLPQGSRLREPVTAPLKNLFMDRLPSSMRRVLVAGPIDNLDDVERRADRVFAEGRSPAYD